MSEIKEMNYDGPKEILYHEEDNGYGIAIMNMGGYPCAYVKFPGIENVESYDYITVFSNIPVHGGFSYLGDRDDWGLDGIWLGWDYAHCDDYFDFHGCPVGYGKKWTTEEILEEARSVIDAVKAGEYSIEQY